MPPERVTLSPRLRLGTSSWTAKGWLGTFYPSGTKSGDYLTHYAQHYNTVEIDATFYATPAASTVAGWRAKTPDGFLFAAKAPQLITHEKFLEDCKHELHGFLEAMAGLGPKLGPILFQFPYYAKKDGVTEDEFLTRLSRFLKTLPKAGYRFAVEVRNKTWINAALFEILHDHGVACCLIDHPWMSPPDQLFKHREIVTAPFVYVRWLGDRYGIEKITKVWNQTVVDRAKDLDCWVPHVRTLIEKKIDVYGYVNNHYAGYAPENVDQLIEKLAQPES